MVYRLVVSEIKLFVKLMALSSNVLILSLPCIVGFKV